ncbi:bifunctional DNA-binding transcriptional regulator/O6-methylguanine-DNA methyltransferase Ada [Elongatibacter sediminis]|uniref:methylated-DNA--[protein]-cysteine S-methyltransferase n=1 Tax=Elongatibacter sediminis TaxID=3119006 RepID=A0AAW9R6K2_9GAMM
MNTARPEQTQLTIPSQAQMAQAVADRDPAYDGRFFYGVVTTGVVCRPVCPSRRARPENLRFFLTLDEALQAGFRPCKRCRPDRATHEAERVSRIARHIEQHADERLSLATLAAVAGLSPGRLQKTFKTAFGVSPRQYQDAVRLDRFKADLKAGEDVTGAIFAAGFGSTSRIYGHPARNLGMTPAVYRSGGDGERIHYACRKTALGPLLMAATGRGVCFAQFGDDQNSLLEQLHDEFPKAELTASPASEGPELDAWIDALDHHLSGHGPRPDLPLDLRGTAFQVQVWRFLLSVTEGDVVSYGDVARGIGKPRAVRAVASACGANRVGILVPCHRVLRGDGQLGGYRWGLDRKRSLIDLERRRRKTSG